MRAAAPAYIVPFMFVFGPSLMLSVPEGSAWYHVLWPVATAMIGVIALAGSLFGWFIGAANRVHRVMLFIAALSLIKPGLITDIVGFGLLGLVIVMQLISSRKPATA